MKNNLWIILIAFVTTLSSCITAAQFNNAEDDVYYSPKASNRKAPVMIPEVDVDEIIRQHPPQYGTPTNFIEDENYPNLTGAAYYPMYRGGYEDSLSDENPRVSSYINLATATEMERLYRMHNGNQGSWGAGADLRWLGQILQFGLNSYPSTYAGYNDYYSYYGPYNSYYWNGWGACNRPTYHYNSPKNKDNPPNENNGTSRRRTVVGNYTPPSIPNNDGGQTAPVTNRVSRGRYTAPALPERETQQETRQASGRSAPRYTPSTPQQNLENVNGRTVYSRPREAAQPASTPSGSESSNRSSSGSWSGRTPQAERPSSSASQQTYTPSTRSQNTASPNTVRSNSGGGRSSAPAQSGSSSGGRRR